MKTSLTTIFSAASTACALLLTLLPCAIHAQTAVSPRAHIAAPEMYKVIAEGYRYRVMEVTLKPGQRDPVHSHPEGTAVYYVTDCSLKTTQFGVDVDRYPAAGEARFYPTIDSHSTLNVGKKDCKMVFIEPQ